MWSEVEHHLFLTFSKDHGIRKCRETGSDFDRSTSSVVEDTIFESPSIDIPCPACNGTVDKRRPEEYENHGRNQTTSFGNGTNYDGSGSGAELELCTIRLLKSYFVEKMTYLIERIQ